MQHSHHSTEFPAGAMKPATLRKKLGSGATRHAAEAAGRKSEGQQSAAAGSFRVRVGQLLCREFPHALPMPRAVWMLLALLEGSVCSAVFWLVAVGTILTAGQVRGHMEYCCAFYTYLAFALLWLYPLALLLTGWRRSFTAARFLLLGMGWLCVAASGVNLAVGALTPEPIVAPRDVFGGSGYELPLAAAVIPLLLLGAGCLLRARCGRLWGHCFYVAALIRSWQTERRAFCLLAAILALYAAAFLLLMVNGFGV